MVYSNKEQAFILSLAAILAAIGTSFAAFPIAMLPPEQRWIVAVICWFFSAFATALKELGGYEAPKEAT